MGWICYIHTLFASMDMGIYPHSARTLVRCLAHILLCHHSGHCIEYQLDIIITRPDGMHEHIFCLMISVHYNFGDKRTSQICLCVPLRDSAAQPEWGFATLKASIVSRSVMEVHPSVQYSLYVGPCDMSFPSLLGDNLPGITELNNSAGLIAVGNKKMQRGNKISGPWFPPPPPKAWKTFIKILLMFRVVMSWLLFNRGQHVWLPWAIGQQDFFKELSSPVLLKHIPGYLGYVLSQWEKMLQCNIVSHWLSQYP